MYDERGSLVKLIEAADKAYSYQIDHGYTCLAAATWGHRKRLLKRYNKIRPGGRPPRAISFFLGIICGGGLLLLSYLVAIAIYGSYKGWLW